MTKEELKEYIRIVCNFLRSDFNAYEKAREKKVDVGAGPYLLTASSGIDFLGSLAVPEEKLNKEERENRGLQGKSTKGSKWYIETYLGKINSKYSSTKVAKFIYESLRCGQVHEGMVKEGVSISAEFPEEYHLVKSKLKQSNTSSTIFKVVLVNTRTLASDFIKSIDSFIEDLESKNTFAAQMADRLEKHFHTSSNFYQDIDLTEREIEPDSEIFDILYERSSYSPKDLQEYLLKGSD